MADDPNNPNPYPLETRLSYAKPGPYVTSLPPQDEQKFQGWVKQNKVPFENDSPTSDYDLRGFWKGAQQGDPEAHTERNPYDHQIHYSDKWKTPYSEEGFSDQSMYAKPEAPGWEGDDALGWKLKDKKSGKAYKSQPGVPKPGNVPPPAGSGVVPTKVPMPSREQTKQLLLRVLDGLLDESARPSNNFEATPKGR